MFRIFTDEGEENYDPSSPWEYGYIGDFCSIMPKAPRNNNASPNIVTDCFIVHIRIKMYNDGDVCIETRQCNGDIKNYNPNIHHFDEECDKTIWLKLSEIEYIDIIPSIQLFDKMSDKYTFTAKTGKYKDCLGGSDDITFNQGMAPSVLIRWKGDNFSLVKICFTKDEAIEIRNNIIDTIKEAKILCEDYKPFLTESTNQAENESVSPERGDGFDV